MEKEATTSTGLSSSDNKSSSNSDVVRLMKLHSAEAFPSKIWMDIHRQENPPVDAGGGVGNTGGTGGGGEGGGGGGVGPTGVNNGGANEVVGHIYRDDVSSSCVGGENFARSCTKSQPFDISSSYSTTPYKSPGVMAPSVAFPFTSVQWKELERQAMIYKYMISSVPVPPHLLFPLSRNFPAAAVDSSASSLYNVGYSRNGDPEPGRCKRTDGKKWRCAREVAPNQKYCERHLHRGRPRSRKPVEVKNKNGESHKKTRRLPNSSTASQQLAAKNDQPLLLFNSETDLSISRPPYIKRVNRDLDLMEGEMVAMDGAEQQWRHLVEGNMGFPNEGSSIYGSSALFHQDYVDQMSLNVLPYSNFSAPEIDQVPTGFIDAWSTDNLNTNNNENGEYALLSNHENLSPSLDLSIAMAAGNFLDAEMGNVQFRAGVRCCDDGKSTTKDPRWSSPVSWEPFARGGPLAEALQPGSVAVRCTNPASPHDCMSNPATSVSSPSGVLHRTLFSHSDSSVCNSPTFAVHTAEGAFQRLN